MRYKVIDREKKLEIKEYATVTIENNAVKNSEELLKKVIGTLELGQ